MMLWDLVNVSVDWIVEMLMFYDVVGGEGYIKLI